MADQVLTRGLERGTAARHERPSTAEAPRPTRATPNRPTSDATEDADVERTSEHDEVAEGRALI